MKEFSKTMLTILGPTATGKTRLAALVADKIDGEIISADSRQVYRGMDIGSGKDYDDYKVGDKLIPYHLVDIVEAGTEYNVFHFKNDCLIAYKDILSRNKFPILCGGTGFYIEAILGNYTLIETPVNNALRDMLNLYSDEKLISILSHYRKLHNTTDTTDRNRLIRAIELEQFKLDHPHDNTNDYDIKSNLLVGIQLERNSIYDRITKRLKYRLRHGMIEEVRDLIDNGLSTEQLKYYGLEYRFITMYITNEITYKEMVSDLEFNIKHFAKRQMTWFRRMQEKGYQINWIDGNLDDNDKVNIILNLLSEH